MNISDAESREKNLQLLLQWEGRLNNGRVRELFGLSQVRASEWIREFRDQHPTWTVWDSKARSFYATGIYRRRPPEGELENDSSLSRYLILAGLPFREEGNDASRIVWAAYPDLHIPNPTIFAAVLAASRDRVVAEISYRSMRQPQPHTRLVSPHSIVRAGRRWHMRAYCHQSRMFKDFALGRIGSVRHTALLAESSESDDLDWNRHVKLKLAAHPALTAAQASLVEAEYFAGKKTCTHRCRLALINYVIQDLRVATDCKTQLPPGYQIAVANVDLLAKWLFPA